MNIRVECDICKAEAEVAFCNDHFQEQLTEHFAQGEAEGQKNV